MLCTSWGPATPGLLKTLTELKRIASSVLLSLRQGFVESPGALRPEGKGLGSWVGALGPSKRSLTVAWGLLGFRNVHAR